MKPTDRRHRNDVTPLTRTHGSIVAVAAATTTTTTSVIYKFSFPLFNPSQATPFDGQPGGRTQRKVRAPKT